MFIFGPVDQSLAQDRADELDRPVRVLVSGITQQLIQEVRAIDVDEKIDFSYPSADLSDFDILLILVDEQQDAFDLDLFTKFGFSRDTLPERGEHPFMTVVSVEFEGDDTLFPVYVVDRRKFYSRDTSCHAPLLNELILRPDWSSVADRQTNYKLASDCEPIS